jgi:hypothetical protein
MTPHAPLSRLPGRDLVWQKSLRVPGWEFVRLSGTGGQLVSGPTTLRSRCHTLVTYPVWISDGLTECYLLDGSLTINGQRCEKGDYFSVGAAVEQHLQSEGPMELLTIIHGRYVFPHGLFAELKSLKIAEEDALLLSARPWIDILRRHVTDEQEDVLRTCLAGTRSNAVRTLCIGLARKIAAPSLAGDVAAMLGAEADMDLELRIGAFLFLASKGRMTPALWARELAVCDRNRDRVIGIMKRFHSAKDRDALRTATLERRASTDYETSWPFYDLVLRILSAEVSS